MTSGALNCLLAPIYGCNLKSHTAQPLGDFAVVLDSVVIILLHRRVVLIFFHRNLILVGLLLLLFLAASLDAMGPGLGHCFGSTNAILNWLCWYCARWGIENGLL